MISEYILTGSLQLYKHYWLWESFDWMVMKYDVEWEKKGKEHDFQGNKIINL